MKMFSDTLRGGFRTSGLGSLTVERGGFRAFLDEADPPADPPAPVPTLTAADVDKQVNERLKKIRAENAKLTADNQKLVGELAKKDQRIEELEAQLKEGGLTAADKGTYEVEMKRLQRKIEESDRKIEEEKTARIAAENAKAISERDTFLRQTLREAGAIDPDKAAFRFILPDVRRDDDQDCWIITKADGGEAKVTKDVLADILPDNMKKSSLQGGGSGSTTQGTKMTQKKTQLAQAEAELKTARDNLRAQPQSDACMVQFERAKKRVAELQRELQAV